MGNFFEDIIGIGKGSRDPLAAAFGDVLKTGVAKIPVIGGVASDVLTGVEKRNRQKKLDKAAKKAIKQQAKQANAGTMIATRQGNTASRQALSRGQQISRDRCIGRGGTWSAIPGGGGRCTIPRASTTSLPPAPVPSRTPLPQSVRPKVTQERPVFTNRTLDRLADRNIRTANRGVLQATVVPGGVDFNPLAASLLPSGILPGAPTLSSLGLGMPFPTPTVGVAGPILRKVGTEAVKKVAKEAAAELAVEGIRKVGELGTERIRRIGTMANGPLAKQRNGVGDVTVRGLPERFFAAAPRFAIHPATGNLADAEQIMIDGYIPKAPFYKWDAMRNVFKKIKPRRMNPLNFKALKRAQKRTDAFEDVIMKQFRVVDTGKKLKPRCGKIRRKKTSKKRCR